MTAQQRQKLFELIAESNAIEQQIINNSMLILRHPGISQVNADYMRDTIAYCQKTLKSNFEMIQKINKLP